jgi:gliding motility-associated-like protein
MKRFVLLGILLLLCVASMQGQNYTMTNGQTITTCSGTFYDPGGPNGNYGNSLNYTQTIVSATPGMCIQVSFNSFELESVSFDYLRIYSGTSASGQLIGTFGGSNSPGTVTSYTGALTFVFHSDVSVNYAGWAATISCVECPPAGCNPQSTTSGSPCSQQTAASPFCTDENPYGVTYPSGTGSNSASAFLGQSDISCLYTTPRPAWYYMQISTPGNLLIYIQQTSTTGGGLDVDFACWGPFEATSQDDFVDNLCCGVYTLNDISHGSHRPTNGNHTNDMGGYPDGNVVDCSYSAQSTEWCYIPNAQPGQWYLLLITNFNGGAGTITFSPVAGSSNATTNCSLLAPISYNEPLCEGDTMVLTCENPQTGATYHWSGPGGWTATTTVPSVSIPNVTTANTGVYHLQLTGPNITADPSQIEVTVNALPTVSVTANHDTVCSGTSVTLTANGASTYRWMPGNNSGQTKTVTPATTADAGPASNTYTVTGTTGGCSSTASYTIVVLPKPTASINPTSVAICRDDTATLYASGGVSYEWRQGSNTTAISLEDSILVSPQSGTTYRVIATNEYGCTNSTSRSVTVRARPNASISGVGQICRGDSALLTSASATSYLWSTGAITRTVWVHPTVTSDYEVMVSNTYGCTATATKNVIVSMLDSTSYRDTICWNQTYQDANFTVATVQAPGTYRYDTTYQTAASCDSLVVLFLTVRPMSTPEVVYDTACVSYTWRGTTYTQSGVYQDSTMDADGCLRIDTLHLVVREVYDVVQTEAVCESFTWINGVTYTESTNDPVHTIAAATSCDSTVHLHLTVYHAEHEYIEKDTCSYYQWRGNTYTESGLYTFSANDAHGCPYTDTLILSLHYASPASMNAQSCDSYQWNGTTYYTTGVYTYGHADADACWQVDTLHLSITPPAHQSTTLSACETYEWHGVTYNQSGNYFYSHTDANGCSQVDTLHLTIHRAVPIVERVIICEPNTYTWHGFMHNTTGTHTYNYIDEHNCECVDTLYLTVTTEPELLLNMVMDATCNEDNGEIKVSASGGTAPYRYVYLPSGETASFEGLSAGHYHLQMIDSIGCSADAEFTIENIIHQVNLVDVTDAHCGRADGAVQIAASGGYGEFTYQWSSPITSTSSLALSVPAGTYNVAVIDSDGCSLSLSFIVHDIPGPHACFTFNTANEKKVTFINCTSQDVVNWYWSFGDGGNSTEWQPTHTYEETGAYPVVLTVEDINQCVDSVSLMYVIHEVPTFYLPSAFIPESDIAENRVFKPIGNSISEENYEMLIFDRWGQLVFVSRHPEYGWDGRINGNPAPQGTYSYSIKYWDIEGKPNSVHGNVLLLR